MEATPDMMARLSLFLLLMFYWACSQSRMTAASDYYAADDLAGQSFTLKVSSEKSTTLNFTRPERCDDITIAESNPAPRTTTQSVGEAIENEATQTGRDASTATVEAKIDIGIVIDDSASVEDDERKEIAQALSKKLATTLKGSHWRVHITGTSKAGTKRVGLVTYEDRGNKAEAMEDEMVATKAKRGRHYWHEVALYKARRLANYFRSGSDVVKAFIIISDEDLQCYSGTKFTHFCSKGASNFKNDFVNQRSAVYGIIAPYYATCTRKSCQAIKGACSSITGKVPRNSKGCSSDKNEEFNLKKDAGFCGQRGGHMNACYKRDDDWKPARSGWENSGLFAVTANIGGNYDAIFKEIADDVAAKTRLIAAKPFLDSITLKHSANEIDMNTIKVIANGKRIPRTGYQLAGKKLTITAAPLKTIWPTGKELAVTYKLAVLNKRFPLPAARGDVLVRDSVKVNGSSSGFTIAGNQVVLDTAPAPGTKVVVAAKYMQTSYTLEQKEHRLAGDVTVCEKGTGNSDCSPAGNAGSIACNHAGRTLTFPNPDQISAGDMVRIIQKVDVTKTQADKRVSIAQNYVVGSVTLKIGSEACDESQLALSNSTISVAESSNCSVLQSLNQNPNQNIRLTYKVYDSKNVFSVNVPLLVGEQWVADVKVDGKALTLNEDYVLDEAEDTITFIDLDAFAIDAKAVVSFLPKTE